jgi:hypothetical protein
MWKLLRRIFAAATAPDKHAGRINRPEIPANLFDKELQSMIANRATRRVTIPNNSASLGAE